jgi:hypothetical protein
MVDLVVVDGVLVELVDDDCSEYGVDAETVQSVMRDTVIPDMKKCYGCTACGGSDHSHVTCVLIGAALHRWMLQLGQGKDMTLVVDIILRLLMWGWREARFDEEITCLSYTPGGDIISAGGSGGSVFFMRAQTGEKILCLPTGTVGGFGEVDSMAFSSDGSIIAAAYYTEIQLFDAQTQEKLGSPLNVDSFVWRVAFSPCGKTMAVGCNDGTVEILDVATVAVMRSLRGHNGEDGCICDCDEHGDREDEINPECPVRGHSDR